MAAFVLTLSTLGLGIGLFITWLVHSRYHLDIVVEPTASPFVENTVVSVIVPARNEARNIRRCVEALLAQTYPAFELIVVDDRSTDATPHLLAELTRQQPRLKVIRGTDLPEDWAGKPHALMQGAIASRGEWLCFVDADTFAAPDLLAAALAAAQKHRADLFSILTSQELETFWERVILPLVFTALSFGFPARRVNDPCQPDAIANGQFILIRREVYQAIGGHGAVRQRIDEDKALAEAVKGAGYRLILADGRAVARTRMYTSLAEIWEGWTKNIYVGLRDRLWLLLFGATLGLIGALALPLWLVSALIWLGVAGGWLPVIVALEALLLWAYLLYYRLQACRAFSIPGWYAFTLPLGALIFTAMMFASAFKVLSGRGVTWKGRRYSPL